MIEYVQDLQRRRFAPIAATAAPLWPTWLGMLLLAVLVYVPAVLGADLLQFDDNFFFGPDNPEFQAGWRTVVSQPIANAYLPVSHLSLWLDYASTKGSPGLMSLVPHLHSVLLHALAAIVLVRLLLQLGVGRTAAHVVGALFVVHPALCESVAWVSGRKDVLSGLFVFAALHQTVRFAHRASVWRLLWLMLLAAAAMYSKPTAVVLPLLASAVVIWCGGPRWRWLGPLVLFAVTVPIALQHQAIAALEGTLAGGDAASRLAQVPGAFWHYLVTTVWPVRLNVLYPEVDTLARFRVELLPGAIALGAFAVAAAGACWWRGRALRPFAFGLLAFVIALLPFNTAYPASAIAAADRYLYLAVPWLALALVALLARVHAEGPWLAAVLVLPLGWACGARAHDFRHDETLWRASLAVEEANAVAHLNLARVVDEASAERHWTAAVRAARYPIHEYRAQRPLSMLAIRRADYRAAAEHALAAIAAAEAQLRREVAPARIAAAKALLQRARIEAFDPLQLHGDDAAAEATLAAVLAEAPDDPDVIAFATMRELQRLQPQLLALADAGQAPLLPADDAHGLAVDARLAAARELHPEHAGLWLSQALWDQARDRALPALRAYREALQRRPDEVTAWLGAARILRGRKLYEEAAQYARDGLRQRPDPRLRQELAFALVGCNRLDEAEQQLEAFMVLFPEDRDMGKILANLLIGKAYSRLSDQNARGAVRRLVERALAYNPDDPKAHLVLGRLAKEERHFGDAVRHLELAYRQLPQLEDARQQYTEALAALGYGCFMQRDDVGASDAWLRCLEVAPPGFDAAEIRGQLHLAWDRLEARGVERLSAGDQQGAIADFRRCLRIDPTQHWASWLLATALHGDADPDLGELEQLCRVAVTWQQQHQLDAGQQVYLLATTLIRKGDPEAARAIVAEYLEAPGDDADPQVVEALRRLLAN